MLNQKASLVLRLPEVGDRAEHGGNGQIVGGTQPVAEETVSEEKSQDTYKIYQLKSDDELWQYHFENLESLKAHDLKVEGKNYELKYEGEWTEGMHLEGIYTKFNIDCPEDFTGHSLSVGDIVVLNRDGKETAHFVDFVGFVTCICGGRSGKNQSANAGSGKVSSSVKFLPSTQMQRTDMTTFPLPLILWKKQWKRSKLIR